VPVIDDEGFIVAESEAILLYLAEKAGKLIPADFEGRMRVVQCCFAALTSVEPPIGYFSTTWTWRSAARSSARSAAGAQSAARRGATLPFRLRAARDRRTGSLR